MLLNEFLKEHRKVEALEAKMARHQEEFESVTQQLHSVLEKQAAQIQKVSVRLSKERAKYSCDLTASLL
jgi:vacuolar-type H+-ATPase subunit I/STV1